MDDFKSKIDKNILISFLITLFYLIFVIVLTLSDSKEPKPISPKNTEYKLLYFVENTQNYEFIKTGEGAYGKGSFIYDSIGNQINIPDNTYRINITDTCQYYVDLNKFVYDPYIEYKTFSPEEISIMELTPQFSPSKLEIYKKASIREPYLYDFVENTSTKLDCTGNYDVKNKGLSRSPDNLVNLMPNPGNNFEDSSEDSKYQFPYIGVKNSYDMYSENYSDLLINGKYVSQEESGIILNPYYPMQETLTNQISIIGWVK
jgi:hypothetical protein